MPSAADSSLRLAKPQILLEFSMLHASTLSDRDHAAVTFEYNAFVHRGTNASRS